MKHLFFSLSLLVMIFSGCQSDDSDQSNPGQGDASLESRHAVKMNGKAAGDNSVIPVSEQSASKKISPSEKKSIGDGGGAVSPKTLTNSESPTGSLQALLEKTHQPRTFIEESRNAVVFIDTGFGTGTGFFVDSSCTIVTNKHVVKMTHEDIQKLKTDINEMKFYIDRGRATEEQRKALRESYQKSLEARDSMDSFGSPKEIKIALVNGDEAIVEILAISEDYDLAFLSSPYEGCPSMKPNKEKELPLGLKVYVIGNPAGLKYTVTSGIVSGYHSYEDVNYIQTDAAINPGNSGGPLIDEKGNIVGVSTMILANTEGIGFALPVQNVIDELDKYKANTANTPKQSTAAAEDSSTSNNDNILQEQMEQCFKEFYNKQYTIALKACRQSADENFAEGQYLYASILLQSEYNNERKQAVKFFEKAIDQGHAGAMFVMGNLYKYGEQVNKDTMKSYNLFQDSCDLGYGDSCNHIAVIHIQQHHYDKAKTYLDKAIELGSVVGLYNMGYLYDNGLGVDANTARAYEYHHKAAMLGSNQAQLMMSIYSYKGKITKKNYDDSYMWLLISELDEEEAYAWNADAPASIRFFIEKLMTNEGKTKAQYKASILMDEISQNSEEHFKKHLYSMM